MQIRDNTLVYQDYLKELTTWEKEIKHKDRSIKKQHKDKNKESGLDKSKVKEADKQETQPKQEAQPKQETQVTEPSANAQPMHYKRDINNMQNYYKAWDSIDIDKEIEKVEKGENIVKEDRTLINNNKVMLEGKEIYGKTGSANPNTQIKIKGGRQQVQNKAELLKIEGNRAIAASDYERAIDYYTQAIRESPPNDLCIVLYSNRAQAHINLKHYIDAENDATNALHIDNNHIKSLHRRSVARYYQKKFKLAESDLKKLMTLEKSDEVEAELEKVKVEIEKKRNDMLDKMVSGGKYYYGKSVAVPIIELDGS